MRGDTSFLLVALSLQKFGFNRKKNVMLGLNPANETLEAEFNTFRRLNVLKRFSKIGGLGLNSFSVLRAVSFTK